MRPSPALCPGCTLVEGARDGRAAAHARMHVIEPRLDRLSPRAQRLRAPPPSLPAVSPPWRGAWPASPSLARRALDAPRRPPAAAAAYAAAVCTLPLQEREEPSLTEEPSLLRSVRPVRRGRAP